jgi:hypothetical protein
MSQIVACCEREAFPYGKSQVLIDEKRLSLDK